MEAAQDELARDLPGLPIELATVRVDGKGFRRLAKGSGPELKVPWDAVRWVGRSRGKLLVLGRDADGREKTLLSVRASKEERRAVELARLEYLTRRVERDGVLRGTWVWRGPSPEQIFSFALGIAYTVYGGLAGYLAHLSGSSPLLFHRAWMLWLASGLLLAAAAVALSMGFTLTMVYRRRRRVWSRWELGRGGLTRFPPDGKRTLMPSAGELVSPFAAKIDGEWLDLSGFTDREAFMPLLFGLAERAGAACRPMRWPRVFFLIVGVAGPAGWGSLALFERAGLLPPGRAVEALLLLLAVAAGFCILMYLIERTVGRAWLRNALAEGRAMLERLGW